MKNELVKNLLETVFKSTYVLPEINEKEKVEEELIRVFNLFNNDGSKILRYLVSLNISTERERLTDIVNETKKDMNVHERHLREKDLAETIEDFKNNKIPASLEESK